MKYLLLILLLAGCSTAEDKITFGTWELKDNGTAEWIGTDRENETIVFYNTKTKGLILDGNEMTLFDKNRHPSIPEITIEGYEIEKKLMRSTDAGSYITVEVTPDGSSPDRLKVQTDGYRYFIHIDGIEEYFN